MASIQVNDKHLIAFFSNGTQPDHEGWLIKKGEINTTIKRWFALKGNLLFYFEKQEDKKPVGLIVLEGCKIEIVDSDNQHSFKIVFLGNGTKHCILGAETSNSLNQWIKVLTVANYDYLKLMVAELETHLDQKTMLRSNLDCSLGYELAGHVVNVDRCGNLFDCIPFEEIEHARTASVNLNEEGPYAKFESVAFFNPESSHNEVLKLLHHFAYPIKNNIGMITKPEFSWGVNKEEFSCFEAALRNVCELAEGILKKEPRLLEIDAPAYVLGDIHGNFPDIRVFENIFWKMGPRLCPYSIVFLGDFVDRGHYGCEVVAYLFAQKVMNPKKIYLIRGNHEDRVVQKNFTFYRECLEKFKKEGENMWEKINSVFDAMPIAGIIDKTVFVCHGGIPPPWVCPAVGTINNIPCPLQRPGQESFLAWEIMWNDPVVQNQIPPGMILVGNRQGFIHNSKRGTGHCFSRAALDVFLKVNGLSHVIRAHEVKSVGFQIQQGGKLLTVFSSSGYCGGVNEAACILLEGKKIRIIRINTS